MNARFRSLHFRALGHASLAIVALLASACGDDSDGSSSGGGSGGGTTASTGVATSSSVATASVAATSSQSSGGQGGDAQGGGGAGQGGEPSQGGAGQGGEPSQGGAGQGGEPAQGGGGSGQGGVGGDGTGGEGGSALLPSDLYVASNPALRDLDGALHVSLDLAAADATYPGPADIVSLENVALEGNDDGWISYDAIGATGGLMFVSNLEGRADLSSLGAGTRRIEGPLTGLLTPKGIRVIDDMILVADTTARTISAFSLEDEGDIAPIFTITDFGLANRAIWDFDYDAANDILYAAATDGEVVAFDDFSDDSGQGGPSRTFTPSVAGTKISVNLHGIEFVPGFLGDPDVLVLSDVGAADVGTDGQLFTIADPDAAEDIENVRGRILGPDSLLGNPVDLDVINGAVYVAEKFNDRVLRFDGLVGRTTSGDVAANDAVTTSKPESVAISDVILSDVQTIRNPALRDADALVRFDVLLNLQATVGTPGYLQSIESLVLDQAGNAFVTLDAAATTGSILIFDALASAPTTTPLLDGTRRIDGPATGLVAPKGLQLADIGGDVLLVADAGAGARDVKGFAVDAEGDVAPAFTVDDLGDDRAPWDVHYDAASDRLFVACTDGVVVVFDTFGTTLGAGGPARTITPAVAGVDVSTNLHGIDYLADLDLLVLSDVGDANVATDGRLYTIAAASTADGLANVQVRIAGVDTLLGNPVDIALANGSVYVAEKSNDRVLRYDTIATLVGEVTTAANAALTVTKPESVFVRYE